jgi:hypothetical protein
MIGLLFVVRVQGFELNLDMCCRAAALDIECNPTTTVPVVTSVLEQPALTYVSCSFAFSTACSAWYWFVVLVEQNFALEHCSACVQGCGSIPPPPSPTPPPTTTPTPAPSTTPPPPPVPTPPPVPPGTTASPAGLHYLSTGALAGIGVGGAVLLLLAIFL